MPLPIVPIVGVIGGSLVGMGVYQAIDLIQIYYRKSLFRIKRKIQN